MNLLEYKVTVEKHLEDGNKSHIAFKPYEMLLDAFDLYRKDEHGEHITFIFTQIFSEIIFPKDSKDVAKFEKYATDVTDEDTLIRFYQEFVYTGETNIGLVESYPPVLRNKAMNELFIDCIYFKHKVQKYYLDKFNHVYVESCHDYKDLLFKFENIYNYYRKGQVPVSYEDSVAYLNRICYIVTMIHTGTMDTVDFTIYKDKVGDELTETLIDTYGFDGEFTICKKERRK